MKVKKITHYSYKLLKLQLIKAKVYKKNNQLDKFNNNSIEQVEIFLKKALHVIYHYHLNNKKIFFVGVPSTIEKKFLNTLKKTNHLFLPESIWVNGILSNKASIYQYLRLKQLKTIKNLSHKNKDLKLLFLIKKKPDLVVILNQKMEKAAINESYKLRIPTITLNLDSVYQDKSLYKVPGNFKFLNKKTNNVFFLLLNSIFKKLR